MLFGEKRKFAIEIAKLENGYQLMFYIDGNDIMAFTRNGKTYRCQWTDFDDLTEWIDENLVSPILQEKLPVETNATSAVDIVDQALDSVNDGTVDIEQIQDWVFHHSWLTTRAGSFLADVYFRKTEKLIEVSWNNEILYQKEGVSFVYPRGVAYVDDAMFFEVVNNFVYTTEQSEWACRLFVNSRFVEPLPI